MFDAIVVGARCAGSPLAMLLSRRGYRVLVIDKARFPSDTVSTHVIWHAGLARAKRWGLLERIQALGAPPIRRVSLHLGAFEIAGSPLPIDGIDYALAPRRTALDAMLVAAAAEAGAEVREGVYVSELLWDGDRVSGIRGKTENGAPMEEQARIVIGADGTRSFVAQAVRAPKYNERPSPGGAYYTYWRGGPAVSAFETHIREGYGGAMIPTNDGLTCIVAGSRDADRPDGTPEEAYREIMSRIPRMREFLSDGEPVERVAGMREFPAFFRKPWGDGWALAGDAGYHKHPLSAQGISDAFRDADMLAEAIDDGLSGRRPMAESLAEFEQRRNEAVLPMYESTCQRAEMGPAPPPVVALFQALRRNPAEADRFFSTEAGTLPMREFFAPENLGRIMATDAAMGATG